MAGNRVRMRVRSRNQIKMGNNPYCWDSLVFGFYPWSVVVQFEFLASIEDLGSVGVRFSYSLFLVRFYPGSED